MSIESTWPPRAYDRPRPRRAPMSKLSRTAIQRWAHQLWPKVPRFDWALMPPLACRGRERGKNPRSYHMARPSHFSAVSRRITFRKGLFPQRFPAQGEEALQLLVGEFGQPALAGADDAGGDLLLALDHLVDLLFQGAGAQKLVHLHVAGLADAEGPVGRLVLDGRVPPAVEVEHVVGGCQVQAGPPGLERQDEHPRPAAFGLEARHQRVALLLGHAAVQE